MSGCGVGFGLHDFQPRRLRRFIVGHSGQPQHFSDGGFGISEVDVGLDAVSGDGGFLFHQRLVVFLILQHFLQALLISAVRRGELVNRVIQRLCGGDAIFDGLANGLLLLLEIFISFFSCLHLLNMFSFLHTRFGGGLRRLGGRVRGGFDFIRRGGQRGVGVFDGLLVLRLGDLAFIKILFQILQVLDIEQLRRPGLADDIRIVLVRGGGLLGGLGDGGIGGRDDLAGSRDCIGQLSPAAGDDIHRL